MSPDFEAAARYALERLDRDLSPKFVYHSSWHTRSDVLPAAERLAKLEGLELFFFVVAEHAACGQSQRGENEGQAARKWPHSVAPAS